MTQQHSRMIFVNVCVSDLEKAMTFWKALGFTFNMKFTNEQGACMIISEHAFAMLLTRPFFQTFTKKEICDSKTHSEALICLSAGSRAEVDEMVAGLSSLMEPIIIVFLGGLIGGIVVSMYLPIFKLGQVV